MSWTLFVTVPACKRSSWNFFKFVISHLKICIMTENLTIKCYINKLIPQFPRMCN